MKHTLLIGLLIASLQGWAQTYKGFHLNLAGGISSPMGDRSKNGYLIAIEPKVGLNRLVDIGLRYEATTAVRGFKDGLYVNVGTDVQTIHSLAIISTITVINENGIRPFVGAGVGLFITPSEAVATVSGYGTYGADNSGTYIGGVFRAGFKAGRLALGVDYNLVPDTNPNLRGYSGSGTGQLVILNSYLGFKLGVNMGGRKN